MAVDRNPGREDYSAEDLDLAYRTCLHLAVVLGDLVDDMVIVGGLAPSLLVSGRQDPDFEPHRGTMDVDLGLSMAVLEDERYATVAELLRGAGFTVDLNERENITFYRWRTPNGMPSVTIDFLMPEEDMNTEERIAKFGKDFGALPTQGLQLAWRDSRKVTLAGYTLHDQKASRDVSVCGPGSFVILKARAIRGREKNKDAYDLHFLLQHYGDGIGDVADAIRPLLDDADAVEALVWLAADYETPDSIGPMRAALFDRKRDEKLDEGLKSDAMDLVQELLRRLK